MVVISTALRGYCEKIIRPRFDLIWMVNNKGVLELGGSRGSIRRCIFGLCLLEAANLRGYGITFPLQFGRIYPVKLQLKSGIRQGWKGAGWHD